MERAAIYARVSGQGQELNGSREEQIQRCLVRANEKGYRVDKEQIVSEVFTGEEIDGRPGLELLLQRARQGAFDVLLVDKMDRFSRAEPEDTYYFSGLLKRQGVRVEIVELPEDPELAMMAGGMYNFKAYREKKDINRRTSEGRARRLNGASPKHGMRRCIHPAAVPLYGYQWDDPTKGQRERYVANPETAPVVERVFREAARGDKLADIAQRLNRDGIPNPGAYSRRKGVKEGRGWIPSMLARIIRNPAYSGDYAAKRFVSETITKRDPQTGTIKTTKHSRELPAGSVPLGEEVAPALVDKTTAAAARARLRQNAAEATRRLKPQNRTLLRAGYVVCGYCGRNLTVGTAAWKGLTYYRCPGPDYHRALRTDKPCPGVNISAQRLDEALWHYVVDILTDAERLPQLVAKARADHEAEADDTNERLAEVRRDIKEATRQLEEAAAELLRVQGEMSKQMIRNRMADLESSIAHWKAKEQRFALRAGQQSVEQGQFQEMIVTARKWGAALGQMDYDQRRQLLYELGIKVRLWREGDHLPERAEVEVNLLGLVQSLPISKSAFLLPDSQYVLCLPLAV